MDFKFEFAACLTTDYRLKDIYSFFTYSLLDSAGSSRPWPNYVYRHMILLVFGPTECRRNRVRHASFSIVTVMDDL